MYFTIRMPESILLSIFGDSPRMKIMDYLLEFPTNEFTPSELVEDIGMSRTTVFRELNELLNHDITKQTGKVGKSPTFTVNLKNPLVRMMQQSIHFRSDKIADKQLASKNLRRIIRTNLQTTVELHARQKILEQELVFTKERIKAIPVR